eukprot:gene1239-1818_t
MDASIRCTLFTFASKKRISSPTDNGFDVVTVDSDEKLRRASREVEDALASTRVLALHSRGNAYFLVY